MGNPPKPVKDLKAAGTLRADRHANRLESVANPAKAIPQPPAYFDERHRKEWSKCCKDIFALGVLTDPDSYLIEVFVTHWFIWLDAAADVRKNGIVIESKKGKVKNPAILIMNDAAKIVNQIAALFGFSPRARMGIKTEPKKEVDPVEELIKKMQQGN